MFLADASSLTSDIQNYLTNTVFPQVLGRSPRPAGLQFWTDAAVSNGWTPAQLLKQFTAAAQPELQLQAWIKSNLSNLQPNVGDWLYWDNYAYNNNLGIGQQLLSAMQAGQTQPGNAQSSIPVTMATTSDPTISAGTAASTQTTSPATSALSSLSPSAWVGIGLAAFEIFGKK